jgi:hypothetical protein
MNDSAAFDDTYLFAVARTRVLANLASQAISIGLATKMDE